MNQKNSTNYKLTVIQLKKENNYYTELTIFYGANFGANRKPPTETISVSG